MPQKWVRTACKVSGERQVAKFLQKYFTISIDSSVMCHRALWSGPNFGTCHRSHWLWSHGKNGSKKSFYYLRYISFYRYDIWLSLSQINFLSVANSVCHSSYRKWSQLDCPRASPGPGGPGSGPGLDPNVRVQVQMQADLDPNSRSRSIWWVDRTWTGPPFSSPKKNLLKWA